MTRRFLCEGDYCCSGSLGGTLFATWLGLGVWLRNASRFTIGIPSLQGFAKAFHAGHRTA
jgi:hypothetical protein